MSHILLVNPIRYMFLVHFLKYDETGGYGTKPVGPGTIIRDILGKNSSQH